MNFNLKTINGAGINTWQAKSEPTVYEFGDDKQYNTLQSAVNAYQADFTAGRTSLGVIFCYKSLINENVTVGGTPYIASTVDVSGYFRAKANSTDADSTAFKFGYGIETGKRGLLFNAS